MSVPTLAELKACLGIPDAATKDDVKLQLALDEALATVLDALCLDQCQPMEYDLCAHAPPGECIRSLDLLMGPVIEVVEVKVGDCVIPSSSYRFKACRIIMCGNVWAGCHCPSVTAKVRMGFTDGSPLAARFKALVLSQAQGLYENSGQFKSERDGRYQYERFSPADLGAAPGVNLAVASFAQRFVCQDPDVILSRSV